jgi:competence protein ComEC
MAVLLERYAIGRIFETGMRGPGPGYAAFAREATGPAAPPIATLATGARIRLDGIALRVLWPDPGRVPREPPDAGRGINDVSIVLLGEVAGRRFLLTGDVEDDVDPILAARGIPPVDVLKVAHHGSGTASTPAFVDEVHPRVAIVSAGAGNPYGHPARSTLDRLRDSGARVLRTDTDGSVTVAIERDGAIGVESSGARRVGSIRTVDVGGPLAVAGGPTPLLASNRSRFACGIPSGP